MTLRPPYGATVPGNRWDLALDLPPGTEEPHDRTVTVVVTHYEQPRQLARTLAALARQTQPAEQVVVADDGSTTAPAVPAGVQLVRQADRGFRAAAARNLGAAHAHGDVLVFLDADTTPEPALLERLTTLPARLPELLAVGRRRHADLAALADLADFAESRAESPVELAGPQRELPEPAWLRDAYARSRDLRDADEGSYRFVISAVLACSRWWLEQLGGFDETFEAYGGEDWDLAHRSWLHGGLVAHVPDAVAWHDGPDAGSSTRSHPGGGADPATAETMAVAARIGVPGAAYRGLLLGPPDVEVTGAADLDRRGLAVTLDSLLAAAPRCSVRLGAEQAAWFAADPRVGVRTERSATLRLHLHLREPLLGTPAAWAEVLAGLDGPGGPDAPATLELRADGRVVAELHDLRLHRRAARWGRPDLAPRAGRACDLRPATGATLQAWLGGWA